MILDSSDPTGKGLFSRSGRNQMAKSKVRPQTARQRMVKIGVDSSKIVDKKNVSFSWIGKQYSREQRERKYKKEYTPSVGMYNPLSANKPKLVWDFLRSYRNRTKPLNPKQEKLEAPIVEEPLTDPPQTVVTEDSNAPIESNVKSQASPEYHSRSQSIVDMSKMTGRTYRYKVGGFQADSLLNPMHSLDYIRSKIIKNVIFRKYPKKHDIQTPGISYSCNYDLIRKRSARMVLFSRQRSRKSDRSHTMDQQNSYEHYEYNSYVWEGNSMVYPNTKTHLIPFRQQPSRYKSVGQC